MSQTLIIDNYSRNNIKESTTLAADVAVDDTSITLLNNNNITTDSVILIGTPGSETAEVKTVVSATGATIVTTSGLTLPHNRYESVVSLLGLKLKVYRASNTDGTQPADADFAAYGAPIDIDPDQLNTTYTDATGSSDYWYKSTFYNPDTSEESALADSTSARGGGVGNYVSIDAIRSAAGFANNRNISDSIIDDKRKIAQDTINGALSGKYVVPFAPPINGTVRNLTLQMAVGLLQIDEYGVYATHDTNNGTDKIKAAEETIEKIKSGQLVLIGADGVVVPEGTSNTGFRGAPDDDTDTGFMFERSAIDGYSSRHY